MKKTACILTSLILLLTLAAGAAAETENETVFRRLAENLYEVTFTDYDPDFTNEKRTEQLSGISAGACSAIRAGNYVGRNLDLPYGDFAEVIVHVPAAEGRYASVGSFCALHHLTGETIPGSDMNELLYRLIPLCVCDGINENGVVCEMNVVPAMDIGMTTGTNPGKPVLNMGNVVRFVLDNAGSAKEAVELLAQRDLCIPWDWAGAAATGWEYHYLIADAQNTYLVETVHNTLSVLEGENVLTNYYVSLPEGTDTGMGLERRKTLLENAALADSAEGMADLMQMVYWTRSNDTKAKNFCYSDHFGTVAADGAVITLSNYENYKQDLLAAADADAALTAEMLATGENPYGLWITLHTCVFDIEARTMRFTMHEQPETVYRFGID